MTNKTYKIKKNKKIIESISNLENSKFLTEFFGTSIFFVSILICLCLSSYSSLDPSVFSSGLWKKSTWVIGTYYQEPIKNLFGIMGSNISSFLLFYFGAYSFILSYAICILSLKILKFKILYENFIIKIMGWIQLTIWLLGLLSSLIPKWTYGGSQFSAGGEIGNKINDVFSNLAGQWGSQFIFIGGIISVLPLCFGFGPITLMGKILKSLRWSKAIRVGEALYDSKKNNSPILKKQKIEVYPDQIYSTNENHLIKCLKSDLENSWDDVNESDDSLKYQAEVLLDKILSFGVQGQILHSQKGPVVNTHEFEPASGVKVSKIMGLQEDLALGLKTQSVVMSPVPGKSTIGIQVPNPNRALVPLAHILLDPKSSLSNMVLPLALGRKIDGSLLTADLAHMPHILVAGSTGSGKSVAINSMLISLITQLSPLEVKLLLIDPKMLELCPYEGIGHLLSPVISDPQDATKGLFWAVSEMERRYGIMKSAQVRNIHAFNAQSAEKLPYIVIVVDELCDLMMTSPRDTEEAIQRLAQKSRAAGIHLILATQRPSVDVITGVIKANLPCRIAFQVSSKHDSRTIIESIGAEKLLGKGDMLYLPPGTSKIIRAHGAYVDDESILRLISKAKEIYPTQYVSNVLGGES